MAYVLVMSFNGHRVRLLPTSLSFFFLLPLHRGQPIRSAQLRRGTAIGPYEGCWCEFNRDEDDGKGRGKGRCTERRRVRRLLIDSSL